MLGPNPWLWMWPQPMLGDGLSFPVNPDAGGESAGAEWAKLVAPENRATEAHASEDAGVAMANPYAARPGAEAVGSGGGSGSGVEHHYMGEERMRSSRGGSYPADELV